MLLTIGGVHEAPYLRSSTTHRKNILFLEKKKKQVSLCSPVYKAMPWLYLGIKRKIRCIKNKNGIQTRLGWGEPHPASQKWNWPKSATSIVTSVSFRRHRPLVLRTAGGCHVLGPLPLLQVGHSDESLCASRNIGTLEKLFCSRESRNKSSFFLPWRCK